MADQEKMIVEYKSQGGVDVRLTPKMVIDYLVQGKPQLVKPQEIVYFMHVCRARKLNPFIKDCYLIKYDNSPAAIVTSVDYFRKNARKAPDCKGWKAGIAIVWDGKLQRHEGSLILPDQELVGGWASAQPEGWNEPKLHQINLATYIKKKSDGTVTNFWKPEKQPDMIMKVAECQLLRQLWGEESTGMYAPEEMPSLEDVKFDGPVQSEIKERIMTGKKEQDKELSVEKPKEKEPKDVPRIIDDQVGMHLNNVETETTESGSVIDIKTKVEITDEEREQIETTFYMLAHTVKISKGDAYDYVEYIVSIDGGEIIDIMKTINEDPKPQFEGMTVWLKGRKKSAAPDTKATKTAETKPNGEAGKRKPFQAADLKFNNEVWNPANWWKKKTSGLVTHVWKNVKALEQEPGPLQQAVQKKWANLCPDDAFPISVKKEAANETNGAKAETYYDPRKNGKDANGNDPIDVDKQTEQDTAPDSNDPLAVNAYLKANFPTELENARNYLGFVDAPATLSIEAVERWNAATQSLVDMGNE